MCFIVAHVTSFQAYVLVPNTTIILDRIIGNARHTWESMIVNNRKDRNNGTFTFHVC